MQRRKPTVRETVDILVKVREGKPIALHEVVLLASVLDVAIECCLDVEERQVAALNWAGL